MKQGGFRAVERPSSTRPLKALPHFADVDSVGDPYHNSNPQEDGISLEETLGELESDPIWEESQLASFVTHPGVGRVLCVGDEVAKQVEKQLAEAQYQVGHLDPARAADELARAAATFRPDLIYVSLGDPSEVALAALETLADDERTCDVPGLALVADTAGGELIEEAYSRTGCDFFRLGHTRIELLARTHLLVRLTRAARGAGTDAQPPETPGAAANDPTAGRIDLRDTASNLFTAGYFFHRFPSEVSRARRYDRALSVLAVRCPEAKHDEAKALQVAAILTKHLRESDIASRIEPDLFVTLLPEVTSDCLDGLQTRITEDIERTGIRLGFGRAGLEGIERGCSPQELLERARTTATDAIR